MRNASSQIIAYLTDIHLGQQLQIENGIGNNKLSYVNNSDEHKRNFIAILDNIQKMGIKKVVFGGDIGTRDLNAWFFDKIAQYQFELLMVLGNHDLFSEVRKYYQNAFTEGNEEMNYCFVENDFKHIILDSSSNAISSAQLDWLKHQLYAPGKVLLFIHHPVLKIDTPLDYVGAALKNRDELKKALIDSATEVIVFCGHYHMVDELIEKNIRQISTVAGSYQIVKESSTIKTDQNMFGYRLIRIDGCSISTDTILLAC